MGFLGGSVVKNPLVMQETQVQSLLRELRSYKLHRASLVTQVVKKLHATQKTWVQFLGQEDPLEKEMETHSSILAWKIP